MNYNWSNYNLQDRLDNLKRLEVKVNDPYELELLQYSMDILDAYISEETNQLKYFNTEFNEDLISDYNYFKKIDFLKKDILTFSQLGYSDDIEKFNFKRRSFSKKDILELTHDFYKEQGKEVFRYFLKAFETRQDHLRFVNDNGNLPESFTVAIPYTKEAFIQLWKEDNMETFLNSIHEYAHATSFMINNYHLHDESKEFLCESDPMFFEMVACDYIKKQLDLGDEAFSKGYQYNFFIDEAREMIFKMQLADLFHKYNFLDQKRFYKLADETYGLDSKEVDQLLDVDPQSICHYITSFLYSIEFYELYKEDKEKAIAKYIKMAKAIKETPEQYFKLMNKMKLIPNEHMLKFVQDFEMDFYLSRKLSKKAL